MKMTKENSHEFRPKISNLLNSIKFDTEYSWVKVVAPWIDFQD